MYTFAASLLIRHRIKITYSFEIKLALAVYRLRPSAIDIAGCLAIKNCFAGGEGENLDPATPAAGFAVICSENLFQIRLAAPIRCAYQLRCYAQLAPLNFAVTKSYAFLSLQAPTFCRL